MDGDFKWGAALLLVIFGGLFGGLFYSEHLTHVQKMECMKLKGEYIGKSCVFRELKQ